MAAEEMAIHADVELRMPHLTAPYWSNRTYGQKFFFFQTTEEGERVIG